MQVQEKTNPQSECFDVRVLFLLMEKEKGYFLTAVTSLLDHYSLSFEKSNNFCPPK